MPKVAYFVAGGGILVQNVSTGDAVKVRSLLIRLFLRSQSCLALLDRHPVLALGLWAVISPAGSTAMVRDGSSEHSEKSIAHQGHAMPAMNTAFWWSIDNFALCQRQHQYILLLLAQPLEL